MFGKRRTTKRTAASRYARYTPAQLVSMIKAKINGFNRSYTRTPQYARKVSSEIKTLATALRNVTVSKIQEKIRELRTQRAQQLGVKVSSSKTVTPAVKRLNAKWSKICACRHVTRLMTICKGIKFSSYKNPKVSTKVNAGAVNSLRREISKLRNRNTSLRRQVAKFRREAQTLQRHYKTINKKSSWGHTSVTPEVGSQVSNIVRFSNALNNAFRHGVRKAG